MAQTKIENMISAWIGNEASYMETELPGETGLLDFAVLVARRVLRGVAAGADRFCFEVDKGDPALWECLNETEAGPAAEPDTKATLHALWDAQARMHEEHRTVPDTHPWLKVREDAGKAKVGVRFGPSDTADALGEVVSASVYHLVRCGAARVLIEVGREYCLVMTPDEVGQDAVDGSFDAVEQPENVPLSDLVRQTP